MSECNHFYQDINSYHSQCRKCGAVVKNPCRNPECVAMRARIDELVLERDLAVSHESQLVEEREQAEADCHQERIRADRLFDSAALMREALVKLRDCDWTITLPDRMDAVRDIARKALLESSHE